MMNNPKLVNDLIDKIRNFNKDLIKETIIEVVEEDIKQAQKLEELINYLDKKQKESKEKVEQLYPYRHISVHDYGYACGKEEAYREILEIMKEIV